MNEYEKIRKIGDNIEIRLARLSFSKGDETESWRVYIVRYEINATHGLSKWKSKWKSTVLHDFKNYNKALAFYNNDAIILLPEN